MEAGSRGNVGVSQDDESILEIGGPYGPYIMSKDFGLWGYVRGTTLLANVQWLPRLPGGRDSPSRCEMLQVTFRQAGT